jgi:hypothetical protein
MTGHARHLTALPDNPNTSTTPASVGDTSFCTGDMVCDCPLCQAEKAWRLKRGVQSRRPIPKHRQAA